jgi:hypothetical protein
LFFDVFGTLVDWRTGIAQELEAHLKPRGYALDWLAFADAWPGPCANVEEEHWVAGGMSPVLDHATVGSDISSATHGSSVASVAGKNRAPTKQWAEASERGSKTNKRTNTKVRRHPGRQNMTILHIWI